MFNFKSYDWKRYNYALIATVIMLASIGVFLIYKVQGTDVNMYLKQIVGLMGGLFIAVVVSMIDYHFISKFYIVLYLINLILLVLVKLVGVNFHGAQRWLDIGFMFQPSELSKIILIIFFAKFISIVQKKINHGFVLISSIILMAIPTFLILTQTDLSTSMVIIFVFVMILFAAGLSWKIILPTLIVGVPTLLGLFWYVQQDYQKLLSPYQQERILSILQPEKYPEIYYQQENAVQAIGSGQLLGKTLIEQADNIRGYRLVPIAESDFIFTVAAEEFGFIGCCFILLLYSIIIFICLSTARSAVDIMGKIIATGISSMFMFQVFVNIGVNTAILPNTGLPLPFLSQGLSSLVSSMIAIGMILNIRLQSTKHSQE